MALVLRDYQERAVQWILSRSPKSRSVCVLPTGGGKTVIGAEAINRLVFTGQRVVFFAHRRELIKQTVNKLMGAGVSPRDIGVLMGTGSWNVMAPALVASIHTWTRRSPAPADVVFIDEAHRSCSNSYKKVMSHYENAVVIGLTATPTGNLGDLYSELYEVSRPSELVEIGAIVEPIVYGSSAPIDLSGVKTVSGDYEQGELERRVNTVTLVGNLLDTWRQRAAGRPTVCFAAGVEHSKHIVATFRAAGIAAEHLDGTTPNAEREAILARLASGKTTYVSNCSVLTEGWDCPVVKCVQLARPTRSLSMYLQSVGRGLRPTPDGTVPIILDHAGAHLFHGLPCEDRRWHLKKKGEPPGKLPMPPVRACSQCEGIISLSSLTCKYCGHTIERVVEVLEAPEELVQVKDQKRHKWDQLVNKWTELNTRRIARNMAPIKRYWISKQYEIETGDKPPRTFVAPPEMYTATWQEINEERQRLNAICAQRNIPRSWAEKKLRERFGAQIDNQKQLPAWAHQPTKEELDELPF